MVILKFKNLENVNKGQESSTEKKAVEMTEEEYNTLRQKYKNFDTFVAG